MPEGTTYKKALNTFKVYEALNRMYQAVNQILFPGKFECNLHRKKKKGLGSSVRREAEKKVSRRLFRKEEATADGCF